MNFKEEVNKELEKLGRDVTADDIKTIENRVNSRIWRENNKERNREYHRQYRQKNRNRIREREKERRKEKARLFNENRNRANDNE